MRLLVVLALVAALGGLRLMRAGFLAWTVGWWVGLYLLFTYGFTTPIPSSAVKMYMAIVTVALGAYVLSSRERARGFFGPLERLIVEPRYTPLLLGLGLALPALAAYNVHRLATQPVEPPFFGRSIHPAPPSTITVHGREVDLIREENPFRHLKQSDPAEYAKRVQSGKDTYYRNCFFCHGDGLAGDGMFAHGLNPIPTNFTDKGVLPNFQESFFFWRVSKGGPGLPEEGGPWDSAMPEWERFLTEEQMWEVVLFLYDFSDFPPRAVGAEVDE